VPQRLTKMTIDRVSLVDKGANQRQFAILKRDTPTAVGQAWAAGLGSGMTSNPSWLEAIAKRVAALIGIAKASKTEDGQDFPASDYAYVPDPDKPSTWKLRLTSSPGGDPDPGIVGAAIAALGKGFRGNKVQIPADDLAKVKAKVRAAWKKAHPDAEEGDMPEVIAKATRTFNDYRASAELDEELPEAFQTLQSSIWGAMWAYGDDDQPLPIDERKALVATNLDQFKEYALGLIDAGMAKRDTSGTSTAVLAIEGIVAKVGRKISAARLTRLKEAADALSAILAEAEADDTATEKRDSAQEDEMTPEEFTKAMEPFSTRLEVIEKAIATPAPEKNAAAPSAPESAAASAAEPPADGSQPATLDDVLTAVSKLADRVEAVEKTPGQPTAIPGQDSAVKKGTGWGNVFGIGH